MHSSFQTTIFNIVHFRLERNVLLMAYVDFATPFMVYSFVMQDSNIQLYIRPFLELYSFLLANVQFFKSRGS